MSNYQYYTLIQAMRPERERISVDEFIWNAIVRCGYAASVEESEADCMGTISLNDGAIERGEYDYATPWIPKAGKWVYVLLDARQSTVHPSDPEIHVMGVSLYFDVSVRCQGYVRVEHLCDLPNVPYIERYIRALDPSTNEWISWNENRMRILEMIPREIIAANNMGFKIRRDPKPKSFTLFPHDFPHQSPIILSRKWVRAHCNVAAAAKVEFDGCVCGVTMPDVGPITVVVIRIVESLPSGCCGNIITTLHDEPFLDQDGIDVIVKIIHFLGLEIA